MDEPGEHSRWSALEAPRKTQSLEMVDIGGHFFFEWSFSDSKMVDMIFHMVSGWWFGT